MCGRFTLRTSAGDLAKWFLDASLDLQWPSIRPRFNIAPTQLICSVRESPSESGRYEVAQLHWGLIPPWSKDKKAAYKMINARSETITEKPTFRTPFRQRRCLIVTDGFYEWVQEGNIKRPFHITMKDGSPFCFGGIWDRWQDGDCVIESAAILTTAANSLMARIHDRMPVILSPTDFRNWLTTEIPSVRKTNSKVKSESGDPSLSVPQPELAAMLDLLKPYPAELMHATPVSTLVNSVRNETPDCLTPVD